VSQYSTAAHTVTLFKRPLYHFMKQVKKGIPKNLQKGIPLKVRPGHTVRLEVTDEPLTVHTGLSLFYAMSETLEIPRILDEAVKVKEREAGYPESEHILALAANAFMGGDYLDDLEALREDVAIQKAIGRKEILDPTTAGDFCRRFTLGHILQMNRAFAEIQREVYKRRREKTAWTIDVDAKVQEVYGAQKEGATKSYNGIYSLQTMYAFVDETEEMLHSELRSGNTHPGGKAVAYLRRMERKIPPGVPGITLGAIRLCITRRWLRFARNGDGNLALPQIRRLLCEERLKVCRERTGRKTPRMLLWRMGSFGISRAIGRRRIDSWCGGRRKSPRGARMFFLPRWRIRIMSL
jgi:hypothetical protein